MLRFSTPFVSTLFERTSVECCSSAPPRRSCRCVTKFSDDPPLMMTTRLDERSTHRRDVTNCSGCFRTLDFLGNIHESSSEQQVTGVREYLRLLLWHLYGASLTVVWSNGAAISIYDASMLPMCQDHISSSRQSTVPAAQQRAVSCMRIVRRVPSALSEGLLNMPSPFATCLPHCSQRLPARTCSRSNFSDLFVGLCLLVLGSAST